MSQNHRSPSEKRSNEKWKSVQYSKGAARSLTVGLRAAAELQLTDSETVKFLRGLRDELDRMVESKDVDAPVLERAVNAALMKMSGQAESAAVPSEEDAVVAADSEA